MSAQPQPQPLSRVTRSGVTESTHYGSLVVVRNEEPIFSIGNINGTVYARSTAKAFQVLPLLERRLDKHFDFTDEELSVMLSSHNGSPYHTALVARILERTGLTVDDLGCGATHPVSRVAHEALIAQRHECSPLHNDCSGKHVALLLVARELGIELPTYLDARNALHEEIRQTLGELAGVDPATMRAGVDGCSAPAFALPLVGIAKAYEKIANPSALGKERQRACERMVRAAGNNPLAYAGEGRLCTELLRALPTKVFPKNGAEAVYAVGIPGKNIGIAIKVADGSERGYFPVVVAVLRQLGLLGQLHGALERFARPPVLSNKNAVVGHVENSVAFDALS